MNKVQKLIDLISAYEKLGIGQQIDYDKFYLYSLITHSTAIEGSTVTEIENQLLFDEGIPAKGAKINITVQILHIYLHYCTNTAHLLTLLYKYCIYINITI